MSAQVELKAPSGKFRIVGSNSRGSWLIDDMESLKEAIEVAHENRCVGDDIAVYDDEGGLIHSE